jgi:hypothetical protein
MSFVVSVTTAGGGAGLSGMACDETVRGAAHAMVAAAANTKIRGVMVAESWVKVFFESDR